MADNLPTPAPPAVPPAPPSALASPVATPPSAQPQAAKAPTGSPLQAIGVIIVVGLIILAAVGYLFWQGQKLPDQIPGVTQTTETAEVAQNGFNASPAPTPETQATSTISESLSYVLPTGWLENDAEGQLTPQIAFLKRLRSGDGCNTIVTARFDTGSMSFNEFVLSQYPGNTLTSLQHNVQYSISGKETFTVRPQGVGESFTVYVKGNQAVHAIFASYLPVAPQESVVCTAEPPSVLELAQSLAIR